MSITRIHARQIFDSRGNPTIEVDVTTNKGIFRAALPSGVSTGIYEVLELRDGDMSAYSGKGVTKAVDNVNKILGPELIKANINIQDQKAVDKFLVHLDGSVGDFGPNMAKYGANAILGISLAVLKAGAADKGVPLYRHIADLAGHGGKKFVMPVPAFNVINGGAHAGNRLAVQEFMILPTGASSFAEAMKMGTEVYHELKKVIKEKYGQDATNVGDEGGFAPNIQDTADGLELLDLAIRNVGYRGKVQIGIDAAASEFYQNQKYNLDFKSAQADPSKIISGKDLASIYQQLLEHYPIVLLEDPFDQDDWLAWAELTKSTDVEIVGDDLLVTNPMRVAEAINQKACNALLLKVNQIGTVTESIHAAKLAQQAGWGVLVSHRSGETEDTTIADLVVGLHAGHIKSGAPCRSERLAKYNQLLRIEEELAGDSIYAGENFRKAHLL